MNKDECMSSDKEKKEIKDVEKPKKNRCQICNKKVGLLTIPCRCKGIFCLLHRADSAHNCQFNFQEQKQNTLSNTLSVIEHDKVECRI